MVCHQSKVTITTFDLVKILHFELKGQQCMHLMSVCEIHSCTRTFKTCDSSNIALIF